MLLSGLHSLIVYGLSEVLGKLLGLRNDVQETEIRLHTSIPLPSVPNQWLAVGADKNAEKSICLGPHELNSGAAIAIMLITVKIITPLTTKTSPD